MWPAGRSPNGQRGRTLVEMSPSSRSIAPALVAVPKHRHVRLGAVHGKGMWITTWADTRLDVGAVVRRASRAGLQQLWIRTGGSFQGWYGDHFLSALLPAAHAAGIKVVAWDF